MVHAIEFGGTHGTQLQVLPEQANVGTPKPAAGIWDRN